MSFKDLVDFVQNKMRMSHIYQPLLIKSLVDAGGSATIRQLASAFLSEDESQLLYYEKKIKEMPLKVLLNRGIVKKEGELVYLNARELTYQQKAEIKMICERRLQDYVQKKGLGIWDYRLLDADPIPDSLRYRVLKEAGGRCALCGATHKERPLDVDHIKPRSKGGKNVYENLQVLCSKCNRSKGNKDDTGFKDLLQPDTVAACPFCLDNVKPRIVEKFDTVFTIKDNYPVTKNHMLVIPQRHTPDFFSMTTKERSDAENLLMILRNNISKKDSSVTGFNVGVNCGESAGQSIFHAHIHLIPRRDGDTAIPRGGVRGVIPKKMSY
ncbi:MAG: HIT domain-containing protein [Candidatus Thorarchaeota archaeon]|jgi:diadenosine tetraphosphate (Ap4A) HIT family hydrolase